MRSYEWRKSSYSGNGHDCVEVAVSEQNVLIRDTKQAGAGPVISVDPSRWTAFLEHLRAD